jgi:hypothetical protein
MYYARIAELFVSVCTHSKQGYSSEFWGFHGSGVSDLRNVGILPQQHHMSHLKRGTEHWNQ